MEFIATKKKLRYKTRYMKNLGSQSGIKKSKDKRYKPLYSGDRDRDRDRDWEVAKTRENYTHSSDQVQPT